MGKIDSETHGIFLDEAAFGYLDSLAFFYQQDGRQGFWWG